VAVDLNLFIHLHPEGQRLIRGWFERAQQERDCPDRGSFEPFIFAWIAFNAWGCCVTGEDYDRQMINALKEDEHLNRLFAEHLENEDAGLSQAARDFQSYWPIFKVQDLRHRGIWQRHNGNRADIVREYLDGGADTYDPQVEGHPGAMGDQIPLSWTNTLPAIYRVRCNLFHGEKSIRSEMDQRIVGSAFRVLVPFFELVLGFEEEEPEV